MVAHVEAEMTAVVALHLARAADGASARPSGASARRRSTPLARVKARAAEVLDLVHAALEDAFVDVADVRSVVRSLPDPPKRADLLPLRDRIHATLAGRPLLAGCGMVFAPGVLVDAPRWLEWWQNPPAGAPVFLGASLGFLVLRGAGETARHAALAFVVGVLLLATVEDVVPQADEPGARRWVSTVAFTAGFASFALLSTYVG
jgi:hypothetical protein